MLLKPLAESLAVAPLTSAGAPEMIVAVTVTGPVSPPMWLLSRSWLPAGAVTVAPGVARYRPVISVVPLSGEYVPAKRTLPPATPPGVSWSSLKSTPPSPGIRSAVVTTLVSAPVRTGTEKMPLK